MADTTVARGIIVRVSVYSSFAILDVSLALDSDAPVEVKNHCIFAVKFRDSDSGDAAPPGGGGNVVRSVGRDCKVGDLVQASGTWVPAEDLKEGSPQR